VGYFIKQGQVVGYLQGGQHKLDGRARSRSSAG